MSGHSKWENIKRKKQAEDAKKGKVFTKLSKNITVAVRKGASEDPSLNPSLRLAIEKAKEANMPKDKIQKAIDRALGIGVENLEEIVYESYFGSTGVAILIKCFTDNKNRTATFIRNTLQKYDSLLASPNAASYIFDSTGKATFKVDLDNDNTKKFTNMLEDLEEIEEVEDIFHNAQL